MLYVTGDTHGEQGRFRNRDFSIAGHLKEEDKLFICGDFGFVFHNDKAEQEFLSWLANRPYMVLFVDGNHENFDALETYQVEEWCGGKVHVIARNKDNLPKVIHLMRGQVYEIEGKKIFTFGGAYSIDKEYREEGISWWTQEMPTDLEMKEAADNLAKHNNEVDFILTHAAPEDTMNIFHKYHPNEKALNNFLEWVRENVKYRHWWFGHLHLDEDLWRKQTVLWFSVRNMINNEDI